MYEHVMSGKHFQEIRDHSVIASTLQISSRRLWNPIRASQWWKLSWTIGLSPTWAATKDETWKLWRERREDGKGVEKHWGLLLPVLDMPVILDPPLYLCGVERLSVHIVHHSFVGLAKWLLFFVVLCMGAAQNPSTSRFPKVKIQQERARRFWRVRPYTSSCWWKPKQIWTPEVAGGNPWESRRRWISRNTMK